MKRISNNHLMFSPSDLVLYARSEFASWMERYLVEDRGILKTIELDNDPMVALLASKGQEHENGFLQKLLGEHGSENVGIVDGKTDDERDQQTRAFMKAGYSFIYQAFLKRNNWAGSADFLMKVPGSSLLGNYHYQVLDTKLAKSTRSYFIMQLCCYSWLVQGVQGLMPKEAVVVLGDYTQDKFRIDKVYEYFTQMMVKFLRLQERFIPGLSNIPDPSFYSEYGRWGTFAESILESRDSLALVANIRKGQMKKLHLAGIKTLSDLANFGDVVGTGLAEHTFNKLKSQAAIQHLSKGLIKPLFTLLNGGVGLSALPPSSDLDVFFDIEGHPLVNGGLEYLWGVSHLNIAYPGGEYEFKDWWGNDQAQEKAAFEGFIDWVYARWVQDPSMHIYHYASYEVTAIRKLSSRYDTRIKEVGELLANGVMVDLYKIIVNSILVGTRSYSIKQVEHLYRGKRTTEVANGGDSVVFYENWRLAGGADQWAEEPNGYRQWRSSPDTFNWDEWPDLKAIRDYNRDDCDSTLECTEWLRELQRSAGIVFLPAIIDSAVKEKTAKQMQNAEKRQQIKDWQLALQERFANDVNLQEKADAVLINDLIGYYDRERKPKNWGYFERLDKTQQELVDDDTTITGLMFSKSEVKDNFVRCLGVFDGKQPVRKDKFNTGMILETGSKVKSVTFLNQNEVIVDLCIHAGDTKNYYGPNTFTLLADGLFVNNETLERRICETAEMVFAGNVAGVVGDILGRKTPVFKDDFPYLPINRAIYPDNDQYLAAIIHAVKHLNNSYLCIQGPPGAGKSFTAKHIINDLVRMGYRVGVMSNSHAAILNLLDSLHEITGTAKIAKVSGFENQEDFRSRYSEDVYPHYTYRHTMSFTKKDPYDSFSVVGGTAYAFANDVALESPVDFLFVDEASQVALANLVAVGRSARNIILLGDQMQLESPVQGSHPENTGLSALDFLLDGKSVVSDDQGVFLELTYRMHPLVCKPLSEVVYDGKLHSAPGNERQCITVPDPRLITKARGIMMLAVEHDGNRQSSSEEADAIEALIGEIKTGTFTDKHGNMSYISDNDILVVSPYNMQVNLLRERLGDGIAVGTIDKFQGQEAPVVIISMAVSDVEESPRGIDFVFDINRLNVAVSRAKALAVIVANPTLLDCTVANVAQMEKVSFFCKLTNS